MDTSLILDSRSSLIGCANNLPVSPRTLTGSKFNGARVLWNRVEWWWSSSGSRGFMWVVIRLHFNLLVISGLVGFFIFPLSGAFSFSFFFFFFFLFLSFFHFYLLFLYFLFLPSLSHTSLLFYYIASTYIPFCTACRSETSLINFHSLWLLLMHSVAPPR